MGGRRRHPSERQGEVTIPRTERGTSLLLHVLPETSARQDLPRAPAMPDKAATRPPSHAEERRTHLPAQPLHRARSTHKGGVSAQGREDDTNQCVRVTGRRRGAHRTGHMLHGHHHGRRHGRSQTSLTVGGVQATNRATSTPARGKGSVRKNRKGGREEATYPTLPYLPYPTLHVFLETTVQSEEEAPSCGLEKIAPDTVWPQALTASSLRRSG